MAPRDPKPGEIRSIEEMTEKRRLEAQAISIQRREEALRSKRLRRDRSQGSLPPSRVPSTTSLLDKELGDAVQREEDQRITTVDEFDALAKSAVQAITSAVPGSTTHLEAIRSLRQLLSDYEEPPYTSVLTAGGIPVLVTALQPTQSTPITLETLFEATWAITNLAVGEPAVIQEILPYAPLLIAYLEGGAGIAVAEQCAWAIGNMAGDDIDHRTTLIANGAISPLVNLFVQAVNRAVHRVTKKSSMDTDNGNGGGVVEDTDGVISCGGTAAWALQNLLRGAGGKEVGAFMSSPGAPEALVAALTIEFKDDEDTPLLIESARLLSYVTAGPVVHISTLTTLGLVKPLCTKLNTAVQDMIRNIDDGGAYRALLTPLLHSLGNIAAGGSKSVLSTLFADLDTVKSIVICAETLHHGLQRESAWILSSFAGAPGKEGVEVCKKMGAIPALMSLLKSQPFHVRKEAAFALSNICAGGGGGTGDAEAMNWLFGGDVEAVRAMLTLVRSADVDAARLGLQFIEMFLRLLPNAVKEVEAADGIDALESLQFGLTAPDELRRAAAELVNQFWGSQT